MDFHQLSTVRKLYKTILKLHKGLPHHLKVIGDTYARDEFKKHKNCKADLEQVFVQEWANYAATLTRQLGLKGPKTATKIGSPLTPEMLDQMSDDQIIQLNEIRLATEQNSLSEEEENQKDK